MMNVAYALGRIFVPIVFIGGRIQKLLNVGEFAKTARRQQCRSRTRSRPYLGGMPKYEALGYLVAAIEMICGLMVLLGLKARWGALVLIVFTACTIIFVHHFWDMNGAAL